jgi:hypothetical protein
LGQDGFGSDPMDETEEVQPSSRYYLLAPGFFLAGVVLMIILTAVGIHQIRNVMVHAELPGELDLNLKQGETYMILLEGEIRAATGPDSTRILQSKVACEVSALPSGGASVATQPLASTSSLFTAYVGIPLFEFSPPKTGEYSVQCTTDLPEQTPKLHVAVAGGVSKALGALFSRDVIILALGVVAALLALWRITMLRLASRKEIRERGLIPV